MPDAPQTPQKIEPMTSAKGVHPAMKGGAAIAAALAIAAPFIAGWEGKRNDPYRDVVGVWTVCYGETQKPMQHYTDAQCDAMLRDRLGDYARPVLARNPELGGAPNQLAAATSLAYNIGSANYAKSTVAKRFSAGNWKGACDAFRSWVYAGGRKVQGLVNRREAERKLCLTGL